MEMPLISVIVPIYKVEAYLDRCISSIVNQTFQNLEIILVDDGSPDNCPAMCDAWAQKDSRIRVIHKKNGGLSDARNAGMAVATGELMGFVDSDDYISPDMYQLLYERMLEDNSDIAACGVEMVWEDDTPSRMLTGGGNYLLNREDAMLAIIQETYLKQPVWYKLYNASLIRDIPFPVGKYHEDVFWSWQAVTRARKISVFDTPCYFYVQRSDSIMGDSYSLRRLDAIEAKQQRLEFLQSHYDTLAGYAQKDFLFTCLYHGQLTQKSLKGSEKEEAMQRLNQAVKNCPLPRVSDYTNLSIAHKCWLRMAKINFHLTCRLRNLLGVGF